MENIDPVCGMRVKDTEHKVLYKGRIYYFCSSKCKEEFQKDPEGYLKSGPRGMPS
ncbi:MAG: YHS domain-containing protein [Nitrososphaeria archaeon]